MLTEIEMKVLRIILNTLRGKGRLCTIRDLEIRTGRSREGIIQVLEVLKDEALIKWSIEDPELINVDEHRCKMRGF